jgi:hypothetical protein
MAMVAVLIPLGLLAVLVALGRYEELILPPLAEDPEDPEVPEVPDGAALAGRAPAGGRQPVPGPEVRRV